MDENNGTVFTEVATEELAVPEMNENLTPADLESPSLIDRGIERAGEISIGDAVIGGVTTLAVLGGTIGIVKFHNSKFAKNVRSKIGTGFKKVGSGVSRIFKKKEASAPANESEATDQTEDQPQEEAKEEAPKVEPKPENVNKNKPARAPKAK